MVEGAVADYLGTGQLKGTKCYFSQMALVTSRAQPEVPHQFSFHDNPSESHRATLADSPFPSLSSGSSLSR